MSTAYSEFANPQWVALFDLLGMMIGIEFTKLRHTVMKMSFQAIPPAAFGQMIVTRMFRDHNFLAQICGNQFNVLKAAPPCLVIREQLGEFISALRAAVKFMHSSTAFWTDALSLERGPHLSGASCIGTELKFQI